MSADPQQLLHVTIQDLPPFRVACFFCNLQLATGQYSNQIQQGFQQIKSWALQRGLDLTRQRIIGIPRVRDGQLTGYDCCVELPENGVIDDNSFQMKQVSGGRYAVLLLEKNSAVIGAAIGRFFTEYAPAHRLVVDPQRFSYEVYDETFMTYFVPIHVITPG
ncbi:MAG: GyrI-like domain-containing protein [Roseiflexus castenholzii]|uniref:GyrI-like domain-containing protein n=1 Tax=Roseiflexus castenholzii TaxID=120962 RepID=UPI000CAB7CAE|nr:MAG: GyrI-like domain-containing protein [Roseiflexus castenholzii]